MMGTHRIWLVLPALAALMAFGCDRNPEQRAAIENLNNHPEIIQRGGIVKEIEMRESERGVYPFRADILDAQGNVIGTVNGARVENFGTRVNRIRWNDGGVGERPQRGEGRGRWQGRQRPEGQEAPAAE